MSEDSRDTTIPHDPMVLDDSAFIRDELQRLRVEKAGSKEKLESVRVHVVDFYDGVCGKRFRQPPPEILHLIFERTIPPLSILDPSACLTTDTMWCQVFRQKITLVSVCKAWYNVALGFLYEHIHIRFIPQLSRLLETLGTTGTDFQRFVNSISFYCMIPASYAGRFEDKLKLFFSLCPNAKTFSYLSSCPLPSSTCLKVLPAHVTDLQLGNNVSYETLMNTLEIASPNLVSLSFVSPNPSASNVNAELNDRIRLPNLETLSCAFPFDSPPSGFNISKWNLPCIARLTLRCPYSVWYEDVIDDICRKHGAGLKYLDISTQWVEYNLDDVLDVCPKLEHIVLYFGSCSPSRGHNSIKWVDIWETAIFGRTQFRERWESLYEMFTKSTFPSLQGVRHLSLGLAYLHNLPIIFPPGEVLTPADSYSYNFLGLNIRLDVGRIHGDGHPRPVNSAKGYSFGPPPFFSFSADEDGPPVDEEILTGDCDDEDSTDDDDSRRGYSENEDNGDPEDEVDSDSDDEGIDRRYRWRWRSDSPSSSEISESDSSSQIDWEVQPGKGLVVIKDSEMDTLE